MQIRERTLNKLTAKELKGDMILIAAAFIFGTGLVAQKAGMDHLGPFTFTTIRFLLGGIVLIPVAGMIRSRKPAEVLAQQLSIRQMIPGAVISGINLAVGCIIQQYGLPLTTVGKAGFICSLYVLMTPIAGLIFFRRRISRRIWLGVFIAVVGFYFLSFSGGIEKFGLGDLLMFLTAMSLTFFVYTMDHFAAKAEAAAFTCIQFLATGLITLPFALILEHATLADITASIWPILYAGIILCAAGYTFQMIGQETVESTRATILLSTESLFSMLAGLVFYHEHLLGREYLGCALIFAAVIIAETQQSTGEGKR